MTLQGKTALVTSAARGIGLAISKRFVKDGARVAMLDVDREVEAAAKALGDPASTTPASPAARSSRGR